MIVAHTIAQPLTLKNGVSIKNRMFKSAMSEQLGDPQRNPDERLVRLYRTWAEGGTGLLISGNIMVDRTALGEPKNVVLDEQSDMSRFTAWATAGSEHGTQFWAQLNHPGKQIPKFLAKETVSPSAVPFTRGLEKAFNTPRALEHDEILDLIKKYATAARLAKEAGFGGVQIHGAHGYLVSQFLSPHHNRREDQWGGSIENRMRFVLEIYQAMRAEVGDDYPLSIKLNSADFQRGGFTEEESMQVVQALSKAGMDLIEISGGNYESPAMTGAGNDSRQKKSTVEREAYFLDYAEKVRGLVDTALVVTGGFRSTKGMNDALATGATDMIGIARPLAFMPDLPNKAFAEEGFRVTLPKLTTGSKAIDKMAAHEIYWYEHQLAYMGDGKAPKRGMSAWRSFGKTMMAVSSHNFKKRRA